LTTARGEASFTALARDTLVPWAVAIPDSV
jgi:hypothetical protein